MPHFSFSWDSIQHNNVYVNHAHNLCNRDICGECFLTVQELAQGEKSKKEGWGILVRQPEEKERSAAYQEGPLVRNVETQIALRWIPPQR